MVSPFQAALLRAGYYPSEEEMEDWVFGGGTQSALLTFQAARPLPPLATVTARSSHMLACRSVMVSMTAAVVAC